MTDISSEIACNLSAPESGHRKGVFRRELTPFLTDTTYAAGTSLLAFSKPEVTRNMLEYLMELERECCAFLNFDLSETETHFHLSVTGPVGSEDMVRSFFTVPDGDGCGCASPDQPNVAKKTKYAAGFISMCAIACAVPPTLVAFGLIGVATGAYIGKGVEAAVIALALMGLGYIVLQYVKKRRKGVSA